MSAATLAGGSLHNVTRDVPWEDRQIPHVEQFSHDKGQNGHAPCQNDNFPSVGKGAVLRIVRLPISSSRKNLIESVWTVLKECDVDWSVDGIRVVQHKDGRVHLRVLEASATVKRVLTPWVKAQHARIGWEQAREPRNPRPSVGQKETPFKFRLASWNVNSLASKRWEIRESVGSLKLGVIALQETMLREGDWPMSVSGFQFFERASNEGVPGARGLALGVSNRYISQLVDCTDHWMLVKVHGIENGKPWHVFNVYIPHDRDEKTRVIRSLRQRVRRVLNHEPDTRLVILGDFNCRTCRVETMFPQNYGIGRVLVKGSNKTFHRGRRWSDIDHILASESTLPLLTRATVKRSHDASDHFPIVTKVRVIARLPRQTVQKVKRIDRWDLDTVKEKLMNDGLWERWWNTCQLEHADPEERDGKEWLDDAATRWDTTSWRVAEKYDVVSSPPPPKFKKLSWEVKRAVTVKRQAWKAYLGGAEDDQPELLEQYRERRQQFRKVLRDYQLKDWTKCISKGAIAIRVGNARAFFRWVEKITKYKGRQNLRCTPIADDNGQIQYETARIAELWAEHFEKLFSGDENNNKGIEYWEENGGLEHLPAMEGLDVEPTWVEVQSTLLRTKRAKAAGLSGLPAEWFRIMLDEPPEDGERPTDPTSPMQKIFYLILRKMWQHSHIPEKWGVAELISIGKKGDLTLRDNYRGISLIEIIVKIITKLLANRITEQLEGLGRLAIEQAGFRRIEECAGQTAALLEAVHRRSVTNKGTILVFIDFKKAYDMVDHDALLYKLKCIGVTERALDFLRALYSSSSTRVRVGQTKSEIIKLLRGCRQGCPGSPLFFDVYINDLAYDLREIGVDIPGVDELMASLFFADDLLFLTDTVPKLKRACEIVNAWAIKWGMPLGIPKCGLMVVNSDELREEVEAEHLNCTLQGETIPWVESYDYLGIELAEAELPVVASHTGSRCSKFTTRWNILQPFLRSHSIPIRMRRHIFMTVCLPVLRWGSEVMGPGQDALTDLTKKYHQALKGMVGSRSKNTIYAILTVRRELDVPSFHEIVAVSRARALVKFPNLSTWVAKLLENPFSTRKAGWIKSSVVWLKKYPKASPEEGLAAVKGKIKEYFRQKEEAREGQTGSFLQYKEACFEETRSYLKSAVYYPHLAKGVTWLLRARVGGIWTASRAARLNLIDETWTDLCPACEGEVLTNELDHILLLCPKYGQQRRSLDRDMAAVLDTALDPEIKVVFLLGGNIENGGANGPVPPWTRAQWTGDEGETIEGVGKPGFVPVAEFLQSVMPRHMGSLWALAQ